MTDSRWLAAFHHLRRGELCFFYCVLFVVFFNDFVRAVQFFCFWLCSAHTLYIIDLLNDMSRRKHHVDFRDATFPFVISLGQFSRTRSGGCWCVWNPIVVPVHVDAWRHIRRFIGLIYAGVVILRVSL